MEEEKKKKRKDKREKEGIIFHILHLFLSSLWSTMAGPKQPSKMIKGL